MKKFIWIGPSGYNPLVGAVENGKVISLSTEQSNDLLERGLIKKDEEKKKTKAIKE